MDVSYLWIDTALAVDVIGDDLWELLKTTADDEAILGISEEADEHTKAAYFRNLKATLRGDGYLLIGRVQGEIVLACVLCQQTLLTTNHIAELKKGVISPFHRGKGLLGGALFQIVKKSRSLNVSKLTLDVREDSIAHKLWQRWGFESFGVLDDYARYQGKSYRGHFMHQSVGSLETKLAGHYCQQEEKTGLT